jgi:heme A synthase
MTLNAFWTTIGMDQQPGEYFFSMYHLVYLLLNIILFMVIFHFLKKKSKKIQDRWISAFLVLILILKYAGEALFIYEFHTIGYANSTYAHPFLDINTFFSFQLCGIVNILLPIVIWFDIKPLKDFVFATSILGGFSVIFYPVTVLYGEPFRVILPNLRSSVIHFFLIFIPLFLIYRGDFKLKKERWTYVALGLVISALWAMFGNIVIDSSANNMYLISNPFIGGPIPILNQLPNGFHVIFLTFAVTIGYAIVYFIAGFARAKRKPIETIKRKA